MPTTITITISPFWLSMLLMGWFFTGALFIDWRNLAKGWRQEKIRRITQQSTVYPRLYVPQIRGILPGGRREKVL